MNKEWKVNGTIVYVEGKEEDYAICDTQALNTNCMSYEKGLENAKLIASLYNEREAQADTIAKLREALKPFAKLKVDGFHNEVLIYTETGTKQLEGVFTVGEVKQARAILEETKP